MFSDVSDDQDETMVYYICTICALEGRNKAQGLLKNTQYKEEHSRRLYEEALREIEASGQMKKNKPIPKKDIKWEKLVRLTPQEYEKVTKKHPELLKED